MKRFWWFKIRNFIWTLKWWIMPNISGNFAISLWQINFYDSISFDINRWFRNRR